MPSPLVLVPSPANPIVLEACRDFKLLKLWEEPDPEAALARVGADVVAIANPGEGPVTKDLLDRLPNVEIIANFGVGYETIDVEQAVRRGIIVTNAAGSNDDEVADTALGLVLMTVRELGRAERHLREGRWPQGHYPLTELSLTGMTLGLLGMGNIGQAIARRAEAFGLTVAYHTRSPRDLPYAYHPSLLELATASDILVVAVPGGPSTRHLVNAEIIAALGSRGVLINVARGSIVDEDALVGGLRSGALHAAGLDVYENEPHVREDLLALPNAVLLPHVGSASVPTRRHMAEVSAANLTSWFENRTVRTPVPECEALLRR